MKSILFTVLTVLLALQNLLALPKFSISEGKSCQSCHINPSGGGMRTEEGMKYGSQILPVNDWMKEFEVAYPANKITDFLSVGTDVETLYKRTKNEVNEIAEGAQLYQANLYIDLTLAKNVFIYSCFGIDEKNEFFGLVKLPSLNSSLMIGKFVPNYGLKIEDEFSFIRSRLDLSWESGNPASPGAQINFSPSGWVISGGIYTGPLQGIGTEYVGKIEKYLSPMENFNALIGVNIMRRTEFQSTIYGGYIVTGYKSLSVSGETDIISTSGVKGLVSYLEGSVQITSGLNAFISYDYFDPDTDLSTGSLSRYNFGASFYPIQGVKTRVSYSILKDTKADQDGNELRVLFHFYF